MTTTTPTTPLRRSGRKLLCLAIGLALMVPGLAWPQEDDFMLEEPTLEPLDPEQLAELTEVRSTLEFGLWYVSDDAHRFGRYRGLEDKGGYGVLSLDYLRRAPHDSGNADYVRVQGRNLGLGTYRARAEVGRQGVFRAHADYTRLQTTRGSARTPFLGSGSTNLTLPADWVADTGTAGMTELQPSLRGIDLGVERRGYGVGLARLLPGNWELSAGFRNEDRDGIKATGGVFGNSGGNPRATLLPEPIDYQTREFDAAARYNGRRSQLELRYHLSLFDNANTSLNWQNPFAQIPGWGPDVGYPDGQGSLGLAPSNRFHQASAVVGHNLSDRTRITADAAFGRMTQSDPFLPYTINPTLAASIVQPLPRGSLDGRIDTTAFNLRLTSRPSARLNWGASYRFDDRDNRTPRDEYIYIGGDSQLQDAGPASSRRRFNQPADYRDQRLRADLGYRIDLRSRLTGSLERRRTDRTYSERERADEDTLALGLTRRMGESVEAMVNVSRARRDGSTYHGNEPFLLGYSPGYTTTVAGEWENAPNLRKFHLADRTRDQASLRVSVTPAERWSIGVDASHTEDDYRRSDLGLNGSRIRAYSTDVSYTPGDGWTLYGFYTREAFDFQQNGASIRGGSREADVVDPARRWNAQHRDRVDSLGAGFSVKPRASRFSYGADYVHARSDGDIDVSVGAALSAAPLPPTTSRVDSLRIHGGWRVRSDWSMRLNYWWEQYRSTDWALDGVAADQLANVILMAEDSPDYRVHVVSMSLIYRF